MEKDCRTCCYKSKTIAEKPCNSCIVNKYKGNDVVGLAFANWKSDNKK